MSLAFVFPGQGSQSVGMMSALGRFSPVIESTFAEASAVLGYDLWRCDLGRHSLTTENQGAAARKKSCGPEPGLTRKRMVLSAPN